MNAPIQVPLRRFAPGSLVAVLTTQPLGRTLDYHAPDGGCAEGDFIEVPLGPRRVLGVVWGPGEGGYDPGKIKTAGPRLDVPPMRDELRQFLARAADYTLTDRSAMLRLATRATGLGEGPATRRVYRRGPGEPPRPTAARARVLDALEGGQVFTLGELAEAAGVSSGVVKGLLPSGAVVEEEAPRDLPYPRLDPARPGPDLSEEQAAAAARLRGGVASRAYGTTLLRGVTGSGKTEVYLEAVAECLRRGRQALVLLPEIALTAEFIARVEARFRRAAGRVALRRDLDGAAPLLADGRRGRRSARGGRALGALPALRRSGARRRRRGARHLLQAGGRRALQRPRHGGAARVPQRRAGGAGLGHPLARVLGQRRGRQVRSALALGALRGGRAARAARRGHARRAHDAVAVDLAHAAACHGGAARQGGADAPLREPPGLRARHRVPRLRPPDRLRPLRRAHGRAPLPPAPHLPPMRRGPARARALSGLRGGRQSSRPWAPAWSGWRRRRRPSSPTRGSRSCRRTSTPPPATSRRRSRRSRRATPTSSSARSSSPRGTTFPS